MRSRVNRANKIGAPIYCGRVCSGLARRDGKTKQDKIAEKAAYDREYRAGVRRRESQTEDDRKRLAEARRQQKADYYRGNHDREKEREIRKAKMPRHLEYCRRPEYRAKKKVYDRRYRAEQIFGPFAEAKLLLMEIEQEVSSRMTRPEIYQVNERRGAQWRKRQLSSQLQA
jgi:hypothetical protein